MDMSNIYTLRTNWKNSSQNRHIKASSQPIKCALWTEKHISLQILSPRIVLFTGIQVFLNLDSFDKLMPLNSSVTVQTVEST